MLSGRQGFVPLAEEASYNYNNMQHMDNIPLTNMRSHGSNRTARRMGEEGISSTDFCTPPKFSNDEEKASFFNRTAGRRKKLSDDLGHVRRSDTDGEGSTLTGMGKIYRKVVNFSPVTRYMVYIVPVGAILAIPIVVTAIVTGPKTTIGGFRLVWFFSWIEIVWCSVWVAKLVAMILPSVFMFLCGVVSPGTRKYALAIRQLEFPITMLLWAATALATFGPLTALPDNDPNVNAPVGTAWTNTMWKVLSSLLISSAIYLGEKLIIQLLSIGYHQRSFDLRIQESKRMTQLLCLLYDASRNLFPMYCREFEEEDLLISDSIEAMLSSRIKKRSTPGSATPLRIIGDIGRFGDKVTSVFGNMASEISGKQVFKPTSSHSIVVEALEKKRSSEALAKRLWMSFVVEGKDALYLDDLQEVLGPGRQEEAEEAFSAIDVDQNGDISLEEMIMKVTEIGRDRKALANSINDIGQAIGVFDQILVVVAFLLAIFVFVAFLSPNFITTLTTAGTTLLSLSFIFAVTAQEFLGSCIFLFVKHPYDVGDRVDIQGPEKENLVVEQISLLYTVFKRIDCMKMVQVPNIVLNSMWIENVTRSKAMKEQLEIAISFDTTFEDVETLRKEIEKFVRDPDNSRDFQPDVVVECAGIGSMDKLILKVEIRHKSNWSNETVRASRRSKFMCALVLALRKVPIYAPGGGGLPLGDPGNPSYSVAVADEVAAAARERYAKEKDEKRLIPSKPAREPSREPSKRGDADSTSQFESSLGPIAEVDAVDSMNARNAADDEAQDGWGSSTRDESQDRGRGRDLDDLREGLMKRQSTRGRRRPGERASPLATRGDGPGMIVTQPSPIRDASFDEEANAGFSMDSRYDTNSSSASMGVPAQPYTIFPQQGLQPYQSTPASLQPSRGRVSNSLRRP
jgi:small-conductance mechanosensitive channel